jgi:predicted lipoprotein
MGEEVGSELIALISDHLNKVKQALHSRSNMDRTMKEEAIHLVSEIDTMVNRLSSIFQGLESMLKKTLTDEKDKKRLYSEQLAASHGPTVNQAKGSRQWSIPATQNPQLSG